MIPSPAASNAPKAEIPKIAPLFKGQKPEQRGGCKTYRSRNVNRCMHLFPDNRIENREGGVGVPVFVFQENFQQNTGFSQILFGTVGICSNNVHADFGTGIAAKHGTVLNNSGSCTASGGGDGGTNTGQTATDYDDIIGFFHMISTHFCAS